jgi:hypothetical protein
MSAMQKRGLVCVVAAVVTIGIGNVSKPCHCTVVHHILALHELGLDAKLKNPLSIQKCIYCMRPFLQVNAFPSLYASRHNGCASPARGYADHGAPIQTDEIAVALKNLSSAIVKFWEPGETYELEVTNPSTLDAYAWIHASAGSFDAPATGTQSPACKNAWYSDSSDVAHAVQWTAPAAVPTKGQCVLFSAAQADSSSAPYSTKSVCFNLLQLILPLDYA